MTYSVVQYNNFIVNSPWGYFWDNSNNSINNNNNNNNNNNRRSILRKYAIIRGK